MDTTRTSAGRPAATAALPAARSAAVVLLWVTAAVAAVGAVTAFAFDTPLPPSWKWLHLDSELGLSAAYSGGLLLLAAPLAVGLTRRAPALGLLGLGLAAMAVDEVMRVHERLERTLQTDWQLLYLPVGAAAVVVLVAASRAVRRLAPAALAPLATGVAAWVMSQTLEFLQWDGSRQRQGYEVMMVVEEVLEMLGTVGIIVALLMVAHARRPFALLDRHGEVELTR